LESFGGNGSWCAHKIEDIEDHNSHAEIFSKHSSKKLMSYGNKEAVKEGNYRTWSFQKLLANMTHKRHSSPTRFDFVLLKSFLGYTGLLVCHHQLVCL
jgi:hypothetical protein